MKKGKKPKDRLVGKYDRPTYSHILITPGPKGKHTIEFFADHPRTNGHPIIGQVLSPQELAKRIIDLDLDTHAERDDEGYRRQVNDAAIHSSPPRAMG